MPQDSIYNCTITDCDGSVIANHRTTDKNIRFMAENIKLWSPNKPNLYTLYIETDYDIIIYKIGFKVLEKRGRQFYLNGEKIS